MIPATHYNLTYARLIPKRISYGKRHHSFVHSHRAGHASAELQHNPDSKFLALTFESQDLPNKIRFIPMAFAWPAPAHRF